jgi:hypothetical protein
MRLGRMAMSRSGVTMRLCCIFLSGRMVTLRMVLGCGMVGLGRVLVMLCCLLVCLVCHRITFMERYLTTPRPYAP